MSTNIKIIPKRWSILETDKHTNQLYICKVGIKPAHMSGCIFSILINPVLWVSNMLQPTAIRIITYFRTKNLIFDFLDIFFSFIEMCGESKIRTSRTNCCLLIQILKNISCYIPESVAPSWTGGQPEKCQNNGHRWNNLI